MQREQQPVGQIVCYALVLLVAYLVSTTTAPLQILGYRIDLIGCVPAAVALMEGPYLGMAFGIAAGIACDMGLTGIEGLFPMYYMLFGVAAGIFADRFLRRIFPSMFLLAVASVLGLAVFRLLGFVILQIRFDLLLYAQRVCGQAMITALLSPLVYLPIRQAWKRFH
ncbi:MAG: hypothetical protein HFH26_05590 [Clostridiaceae bacterium]|nr:hypothetical protein [Clostridiaceae bacterium]